jgi:branched-chain amino acid transport system permease protein
MEDWFRVAALALVAGVGTGLVAAALQAAYRHGRRLDLLPVVTAAAGAIGAARLAGDSQLDRLVGGLVLVPAAVLVGVSVHRLLADRPRSGGPTTRLIIVPLAVAVLGSSLLTWWTGDRIFPPALRGRGLRFRNVSVLTWAEVVALASGVVALGLLALLVARGRTGLRLKAERDAPELLPLVGVDPVRVEARTAGARAAAGTIGGLLLSVSAGVPDPGLDDVGLRAGEAFLVGGTSRPTGALAGGVAVELTRALAERAREGWGPAAGHVLTLLVVTARLVRSRLIRVPEPEVLEEQLG